MACISCACWSCGRPCIADAGSIVPPLLRYTKNVASGCYSDRGWRFGKDMTCKTNQRNGLCIEAMLVSVIVMYEC